MRSAWPSPTSISVTTFGTGAISDDKIEKLIRAHFDLRPFGITKMLDLLHPIYQPTASYGHFGRAPVGARVRGRCRQEAARDRLLLGEDRSRRRAAFGRGHPHLGGRHEEEVSAHATFARVRNIESWARRAAKAARFRCRGKNARLNRDLPRSVMCIRSMNRRLRKPK
jgi:hypothetical protein